MKITDLIGDFVNIFGEPKQAEEPIIGGSDLEIQNRPDVHQVEPEHEDHTEVDTMVGPLQQKLELLKKVAGQDNALDDNDELSQIKHIAGIKPIAIQIASEDNDILG